MPPPKSKAQARLFFALAGRGVGWARRATGKLGNGSVKRLPARRRGRR